MFLFKITCCTVERKGGGCSGCSGAGDDVVCNGTIRSWGCVLDTVAVIYYDVSTLIFVLFLSFGYE